MYVCVCVCVWCMCVCVCVCVCVYLALVDLVQSVALFDDGGSGVLL
jgi:hypothetical protein